MVSSVSLASAIKPATPPATGSPPAAGATAGPAAPGAAPVARANPSYQFDAAAGVVVIQFRAESGKVDLSIPNQQQLKAYAAQRWDESAAFSDGTLVT